MAAPISLFRGISASCKTLYPKNGRRPLNEVIHFTDPTAQLPSFRFILAQVRVQIFILDSSALWASIPNTAGVY